MGVIFCCGCYVDRFFVCEIFNIWRMLDCNKLIDEDENVVSKFMFNVVKLIYFEFGFLVISLMIWMVFFLIVCI